MIVEKILEETDGGLDVFKRLYEIPSNLKKPFKIRNEKTPSCYLKKYSDRWVIKDFGDTKKAMDCFQAVQDSQKVDFPEACRWIIDTLGLQIEFSDKIDYQEIETDLEIDQKAMNYFLSRGIGPDLIYENRIGVGIYKHKEKDFQHLAWFFPIYFKGNLVARKIRLLYDDGFGNLIDTSYDDKTKSEKKKVFIDKYFENHHLPLIGYDDIPSGAKELVICEGEFDDLSIQAAMLGKELQIPVTSVPAGIGNLNWIDLCWDKLKDVQVFYLAVDDDRTGRKGLDEMIRRLGRYKCKMVKYNGLKDANKLHLEQGLEAVYESLLKANFFANEGMLYVNDIRVSTEEYLFDKSNKGLPIPYRGWEEFNKHYSIHTGNYMTLWYGIGKHGKSTFVNYLDVVLAVVYGFKIAIWTPEYGLYQEFLALCVEQLTGKRRPLFVGEKGENIMTRQDLKRALDFFHEYFFFIDLERATTENIFDVAEGYVARHGINKLRIDPLMMVERDGEFVNLTFINDFFRKGKEFKKDCDVNVDIITHPKEIGTTTKKDIITNKPVEVSKIPTPSDLFGGSSMINHPDSINCIYLDKTTNTTEFRHQVCRFIKKTGTPNHNNPAMFNFDEHSNRFAPLYADLFLGNWLERPDTLKPVLDLETDDIPF